VNDGDDESGPSITRPASLQQALADGGACEGRVRRAMDPDRGGVGGGDPRFGLLGGLDPFRSIER
jgi:hypothetical protein